MNSSRWLIAGLGNPGPRYRHTRHNIGFAAAEKLAETCGIRINQKKFHSLFATGECMGGRIVLAKPQAYMNRSGPPLCSLAGYFGIFAGNMIVVHDDIDIELGRIKIKEKGGHGGHNGIRSIIEAFGSGDFPRIRIGIGRPEPPVDPADHVLGKITAGEQQVFREVLQEAENAVSMVIQKGPAEAMKQFNQRKNV